MNDGVEPPVSGGADPIRDHAWLERRFRALVELLPAVVYEAEPGPEGSFRYISPQIEDLLGYSPGEWLANPRLWLERLHPKDRKRTLEREHAHERFAKGRDLRVRAEYRMVHRHGRTIMVRDEARLAKAPAGPWVWRGLLMNVTASAPERLDGGDALRLRCKGCGSAWTAAGREPCRECGGSDVTGISLDATLSALADSRRGLEQLSRGVHEHLDELGSFVESIRADAVERGRR